VIRKLFGLVSLLAVAVFPAAVCAQQPIRVRCGGPAYTDSKGQVWQADFGFNGGTEIGLPGPVKGTSDQALFERGRQNENPSSAMTYSFNVPNGEHRVNLYFAEEWGGAFYNGGRVFNVKMQGARVFTNLDIFAEAGANAMLIKGSDITVTNGKVVIEFDNVVSDALINAIEILPGASGPQLALTFKYPDGTAVAGKLSYTVSSSLLSFQGSEPLVNGQVSCALLANPSALGISVQFTVKASLTDTAGHVLWQLNLGMNPSQVNLATVQNSNLTVVLQKQSTEASGGGGAQ
jgi:hypothetical protein